MSQLHKEKTAAKVHMFHTGWTPCAPFTCTFLDQQNLYNTHAWMLLTLHTKDRPYLLPLLPWILPAAWLHVAEAFNSTFGLFP